MTAWQLMEMQCMLKCTASIFLPSTISCMSVCRHRCSSFSTSYSISLFGFSRSLQTVAPCPSYCSLSFRAPANIRICTVHSISQRQCSDFLRIWAFGDGLCTVSSGLFNLSGYASPSPTAETSTGNRQQGKGLA